MFVECRCSTPQRLGAVGVSEPFVGLDRDLERCARALRQAVLKGAVDSSLAGGDGFLDVLQFELGFSEADQRPL